MAATDKFNRPYARLDDLKRGDRVIVDDGFTCMTAWSEKIVDEDNAGLFVDCEDGGHGLDGQDDGDGFLVGIYLADGFERHEGETSREPLPTARKI